MVKRCDILFVAQPARTSGVVGRVCRPDVLDFSAWVLSQAGQIHATSHYSKKRINAYVLCSVPILSEPAQTPSSHLCLAGSGISPERSSPERSSQSQQKQAACETTALVTLKARSRGGYPLVQWNTTHWVIDAIAEQSDIAYPQILPGQHCHGIKSMFLARSPPSRYTCSTTARKYIRTKCNWLNYEYRQRFQSSLGWTWVEPVTYIKSRGEGKGGGRAEEYEKSSKNIKDWQQKLVPDAVRGQR
ncbi:hypothetical protein BDZ91DRAFT_762240 [Kalaharituber pfeilii]|nr:hypothetical protein BDZ91DRAFT_762240 [Kalaharituber pfeilii]